MRIIVLIQLLVSLEFTINMQFRVDVDEVISYTNRLEKLNRSAFPSAVRNTLNSLAFDVKQRTMLKMTEKTFTIRQRNFFKANSRVETAKGFHVGSMGSQVGFVSLKGNNFAVDDLEQQEHGGKIDGRSFIALAPARVSNSLSRNVSKRNRISGIKNIVKTDDAKTNSDAQGFVKSVIFAGVGGHVLHKNILFRIDSINGRRFKLKALYSFQKSRSVTVKKTKFMERSAEITTRRNFEFYKKSAEFQFEKSLRK